MSIVSVSLALLFTYLNIMYSDMYMHTLTQKYIKIHIFIHVFIYLVFMNNYHDDTQLHRECDL